MASPLWDKRISCPFCGYDFATTRFRQRAIRVREQHSDFGCTFQGSSPYFYSVTACPDCLVAATNKTFESLDPKDEPRLAAYSRDGLTKRKRPEIFVPGERTWQIAVKRLRFAIACQEARGKLGQSECANLWMQLAWIFRGLSNEKREASCLSQAATAYENLFLGGGDLPKKLGAPGVLFLLGEIYRRLHRYDKARFYFSRTLQAKELKSYPIVERRVRDAIMDARIAEDRSKRAE